MHDRSAAESAIRKLEAFYNELAMDERKVVGLIVGASLQRAARAQAEREWLDEGEMLLELFSLENAPTLVSELGTYVAGQLAPNRPDMGEAEKRSTP